MFIYVYVDCSVSAAVIQCFRCMLSVTCWGGGRYVCGGGCGVGYSVVMCVYGVRACVKVYIWRMRARVCVCVCYVLAHSLQPAPALDVLRLVSTLMLTAISRYYGVR